MSDIEALGPGHPVGVQIRATPALSLQLKPSAGQNSAALGFPSLSR